MKITIRYIPVAAALVCCCLPMVSCGTQHAGARAVATSGPGQSAADGTSDDQTLPDTTSDDQQDPGPPVGDTTDDTGGVPTAGPYRWFPMLRGFRAYLTTDARKGDAAIAVRVTSVYTRTPAGSARSMSLVRVDYGVMEREDVDRTAQVFARWRRSVYGDHGHVDVLGLGKMNAEQDW
ncbi:hypothetical protein A6P39_040420 [Streptomyces sp. FXJ1.172]|uniref:hypothetical protein n=1 Tax=Streptomyces sp. FXJ1.172 TaxID=710705 RepID=UPI0007CFE0D5|nr:hypothetical protein [Streptomyces sp. FXJ1.172]WEO99807.1 hypothetical protein A6P39_040420 [Streptomyces sp. FXJ1.172]